jgi:Tol biopolymer transport system component
MSEGKIQAYPLGRITRDGTYYFHRKKSPDELRQLLTIQFDPETGKATGSPSFVSRKGGSTKSQSFSHDGRWLAYLWQDQSLVIQSVDSGEEKVVPLLASYARLDGAVMFPDGRSVLVTAAHKALGDDIYRVDVATGVWTSIKKPGEERVVGWPNAISPDGKTAYMNRVPPGAKSPRLIAREIDTGQEREVLQESGMFALSHDGKLLAVSHSDGKDVVIDVLPAAGGPKREVYRVQGFQYADITWTPDGRYLMFAPSDKLGNSKVQMRVSVDGGEAQSIGIPVSQDEQVQFPRRFGGVRVHPNGRQLVYAAAGESSAGDEDWALDNFLPKTAK